jgi:hypothetical protein
MRWSNMKLGSPDRPGWTTVRVKPEVLLNLAVAVGATAGSIAAARRRRWFRSLVLLAVALLGLGGSAEEVS